MLVVNMTDICHIPADNTEAGAAADMRHTDYADHMCYNNDFLAHMEGFLHSDHWDMHYNHISLNHCGTDFVHSDMRNIQNQL